MDVLNESLDLEAFFRGLADSPARVLMLDYDGTLAPFHVDPQRALPYPGIAQELQAIHAAGVRLALLSGRTVGDLLPLLRGFPPLEIWGSHGGERRSPDGAYRWRPLRGPAAAGLARARATLGGPLGRGARLEEKHLALALHVRGLAPERATGILAEVRAGWEPIARESGLALLAFDGGLELRPLEIHKGQAVQSVLAEAGPGASAAYLGDDRTDEDAFAALRGRGLAVLVRAEPRETAADLRIRPPDELLRFLARWHGARSDP